MNKLVTVRVTDHQSSAYDSHYVVITDSLHDDARAFEGDWFDVNYRLVLAAPVGMAQAIDIIRQAHVDGEASIEVER